MNLNQNLRILSTPKPRPVKPEIKFTYNDVLLTGNNLTNILYDVSKKEGAGSMPKVTYFVYE